MKICITTLLLSICLPLVLIAGDTQSPAAVAVAFYKACGELPVDYSKLDSFRSKAALKYEKTLPSDVQKMRRKAAEKTGGYGTLKEVIVLQERINREIAYVDVEIRYATFSPAKFNATLVNETGQWKFKD